MRIFCVGGFRRVRYFGGGQITIWFFFGLPFGEFISGEHSFGFLVGRPSYTLVAVEAFGFTI